MRKFTMHQEMADRMLEIWPWLGETEDDDAQVSGADTIDQLQTLYDSLRAAQPEPVDQSPAASSMIDVWVTDGSGDYCPETKVFATELEAWAYVVGWLKENAEEEMDLMIAPIGVFKVTPTYAEALDDALAAGNVARLREVTNELGLVLDGSEYTVEKQQIAGNAAIPPPPRVVVTLEGGMVTDVVADGAVQVAVIDYDTDGAEDADLKRIPQGGGAFEDATGGVRCVAMQPERVAELWEVLTRQ